MIPTNEKWNQMASPPPSHYFFNRVNWEGGGVMGQELLNEGNWHGSRHTIDIRQTLKVIIKYIIKHLLYLDII